MDYVKACLAELINDQGPGAAVAVIDRGEVIYEAGFGLARIEDNIGILPETRFNIASVSKQFTAISAAILARQGRLDLAAPVGQYLPWLGHLGDLPSLLDLIHHTSGLREFFDTLILKGYREGDIWRAEDVRHALESQTQLNFAPGTDYLYSNTGYFLLSEVIEAVTGQSFKSWVTENIFNRYGLHETSLWDNPRLVIPHMATGYTRPSGRVSWLKALGGDVVPGSSNLVSTVRDLAIWAKILLHDGLGEELALEKLVSSHPLSDGTPVDYGFGLQKWVYKGTRVIAHDGSIEGFKATFLLAPERQAAVIICANGDKRPVGAAHLILGHLLGLAGEGATGNGRMADAGLMNQMPGLYRAGPGLFFEISRQGEELYLSSDAFGDQLLAPVEGALFRVAALDLALRYVKAGEQIRIDWFNQHYAAERLETENEFSDLQGLAGRYSCAELVCSLSLAVDGGKISLHLPRQEPMPLRPVAGDRLVSVVPGIEIGLRREAGGKVAGLQLSTQRARNFDYERVEK